LSRQRFEKAAADGGQHVKAGARQGQSRLFDFLASGRLIEPLLLSGKNVLAEKDHMLRFDATELRRAVADQWIRVESSLPGLSFGNFDGLCCGDELGVGGG